MKISADGLYELKPVSGAPTTGRSVVCTSGDLGTATVKLVYKNTSGEAVDYQDGAISTLPSELIVNHGVGLVVWVSVSGADAATDIDVILGALK